MVFVIDTNKKAYEQCVENGVVSIHESVLENRDITRVEINDKVYFYLYNSKELIGPYFITSRCFKIEKLEDNIVTIPGNQYQSAKYYRFFFEQREKLSIIRINSYPGFQTKEIKFNSIVYENALSLSINEMPGTLIVKESDYIFDFTFIKAGRVYTMPKTRLPQNWFKDIIELKTAIEIYAAKVQNEKVVKGVEEISRLLYSFLVKPNPAFWKQIKGNIYIYVFGRANFIPFQWMPFNYNEERHESVNKIFAYSNIKATGKFKNVIKNALLISDPSMSIGLANVEARHILNFFENQKIKTEIIAKEISLFEIKTFFENYDLIHFIGHGENGWKLNKKRRYLNGSNMPELKNAPLLVVSNSCQTALDTGKGTLVKSLLEKGVKSVVASDMKIPDIVSRDFFKPFYKELLATGNINIAFNKAIEIDKNNKRYNWIFYKLYGSI